MKVNKKAKSKNHLAHLPCQSGFWVHNHPDITGSTGPFRTQLLAAKFIVEQTGVPLSSLKKKTRSTYTPPAWKSLRSEYVGVYWDKRDSCWRAERKDQQTGIRQKSSPCRGPNGERDAAKIYKDWISEEKAPKKILSTTSDTIEKLNTMASIYNVKARVHEGPGDYEHTVAQAQGQAKKVFDKCAVVEVTCICGKYGPWKDSLIESYKTGAVKFTDSMDAVEAAPHFRDCLVRALRMCDGVDFTVWRSIASGRPLINYQFKL